MKYLKIIIAGLLVFGPFAANADVIYADFDDRDDALENGMSASGTLDLINDINDGSFVGSGYGGPGDGTFTDNLGFPLGTATSATFYMWVQFGDVLSAVVTNLDTGVIGGNTVTFSFATGGLTGTVLASINASGQLAWEAVLNGFGPDATAIIDGVGLTVATPDVVAAVPEPGTLALLGLGLAGMGMTRRKKKV